MNADLEAAIEAGRRRMRQFEDRVAERVDTFDREVDNIHHTLGHKYSALTDDLRPVSYPLWGVVLETSGGHRVFKEHAPFEVVAKSPRQCRCTGTITHQHNHDTSSYAQTDATPLPSTDDITNELSDVYKKYRRIRRLGQQQYTSDPCAPISRRYEQPLADQSLFTDHYSTMADCSAPSINETFYTPSWEAKAIMEGHKWGVNKYLHDEEYVSNAPYGIIMQRPRHHVDQQHRRLLPKLDNQQRDYLESGTRIRPLSRSMPSYNNNRQFF